MAKTKFTDFGNIIGRGKTHRTSGQLMSGEFSRKSGEGPLVKKRHASSAQLKPVSPTMTKKVIQNSATVFSLTGGYYPTFTQSFNNMKT